MMLSFTGLIRKARKDRSDFAGLSAFTHLCQQGTPLAFGTALHDNSDVSAKNEHSMHVKMPRKKSIVKLVGYEKGRFDGQPPAGLVAKAGR